MSSYSLRKNPKLCISNYFDSLIREVDIFIEEKLVNLDLDKLIKIENNDYNLSEVENRTYYKHIDEEIDFDEVENFVKHAQDQFWKVFKKPRFDFKRNLNLNKPSKNMNECDFWNLHRDELIAELEQLQKEAFQRYEAIRDESNKDNWSSEAIMERVFEKRFPFIFITEYNSQEIHLIELDFYLNPYECQLLR